VSDDRDEDDYTRRESEAHRVDRNYNEMLQELRVAQTGVQILFAFLLGIAFQQRFATVSSFERTLYVVTLSCSAAAAILLIAPVAAHRVLFRRHRKEELIALTGRLTAAGLAMLAVAMVCAVLLVINFVSNGVTAWVLAAGLSGLVLTTWCWLPLHNRRDAELESDAGTERS
jgi:amino acid transporter